MSEPQESRGQEQQREFRKEYRRLWELRDASEGAKVLIRSQVLANSYRVFQGNHAELYRFLSHVATPTVMAHMWAERHRYRLDYARREATRLFHNYVAAALSLADTTRGFMKKHYAGTALFGEYEKRKNRDFADAPLHRFIQRLRVYTLHYQLPPTKAMNRFKRREDGGTDFDNGFWLNVDKLRESGDWTSKAQEYLETLGSEAKLTDIINDYEPVVTNFHEWLWAQIQEEHAAAIQETFDLELRMGEFERELHHDSGMEQTEEVPPSERSILVSLAGPSLDGADERATVDDVIVSLYESISFPHGGVPDLDQFRSLFIPDAQFIDVEPDETYLSNVNEHIRDFHKALNEGSITAVSEIEVARRGSALGSTAHAVSEHETIYVEDGVRKRTRGLYSLHLTKSRERWYITSMHRVNMRGDGPSDADFTPEAAGRDNTASGAREVLSGTDKRPGQSHKGGGRRMAVEHVTKTAEVRRLEPHEDAEIPLFKVPFDGVIANVTLTPSEDIHGAYYTRQLDLSAHRGGSLDHAVGTVQLGSTDILLPGGERHNVHLYMPPINLRVSEGDALVWSSIGSVGEGLEVPTCEVEVVFERKDISDDATPPRLWRECVPDYWIGKKVWVHYNDVDVHSMMMAGRTFSSSAQDYVGTFQGADDEILQVAVDPLEHGMLPRDTGFPYGHVDQLKLMEGE